MSDQAPPPAQPQNSIYVSRKTVRDPSGRIQEHMVMDPYGARLNQPGTNSQLDRINQTFGAAESKYILLGHLEPKDREKHNAYFRAWAAIANLAEKAPSMTGVADFFYEAYVDGPAKISMGIGGAAVMSENTARSVNITQEQKKPSRWRLR